MMNNNQIFNFSRFIQLCRHDLCERWRQFLISIGTLLGILVLIGIFNTFNASYLINVSDESFYRQVWAGEVTMFIMALFFFGSLVAAGSFKSMSTPAGALSTLMLPASQFEKFVYKWIVAVPGLFLLFFGCAVVADLIRVAFTELQYDYTTSPVRWGQLLFHSEEAGLHSDALSWMVLLGFFTVQSFFLLGSVVWSRTHFVKTFFSMFVITLIYLRVGTWVYNIFEKPGMYYIGPGWFGNESLVIGVTMGLMGLITLFNYMMTYLRFRESEIINRW